MTLVYAKIPNRVMADECQAISVKIDALYDQEMKFSADYETTGMAKLLGGVLARGLRRHPRQAVQELASELLSLTGGRLQDDATCLCVDWYGTAGRRDATGGASRARATPR